MSKIERYKFHTSVKVRFNETDLQGHVNFGQYYFYFDEGVTEYLTAIGYDYQTMLTENTDFLYVESHCNYKSSTQWPEILHIYTRISHIGRTSLRFDFIVRAEKDDRLVATGHIVAVTADLSVLKPHPVPPQLRRAVQSFEGELSIPQ